MFRDKKETREIAKKNIKEDDNELITHGQSDNEEGVHGTQYGNNDPLNLDDNSGIESLVNCKSNNTKNLSWQEEDELTFKLDDALCCRKWKLAESLVTGSSVHVLNEALCMSLGSIWFLRTHEELNELTTLIKTIVSSGASDFCRAAVRSSSIASYVSAWQSGTMSLGKLETFVDQRLRIFQECYANEVIRKGAFHMMLKLTDWAMMWIEVHQGSSGPPKMFTLYEVQLQLTAFRTFLDLAENRLTIWDFEEALHGSCFSLIIYSCSLYPGWVFGTSAAALRGLLNILVERGADNVNQCILEASRVDCPEVVRMLLQIARSNNLAVDVDVALDLAAENSRFDTMNVLVDEGQATNFTAPFAKAVKRSCIPVVSWFINRGVSDDHLCIALAFAASSNQLETASYLLSKIPPDVLAAFSIEILIATAKAGDGSFDGVALLLSSNFLGSPDAMYDDIESLIDEEDERNMPELIAYLKKNWSDSSFDEGVGVADDHYVNMMRVLIRGCSSIQLSELPAGMVIAIALLPLYRECLKVKGELLPLRLKGELVRSLHRFGCREAEDGSTKGELMTMLESLLPSFVVLK